MARTLGLLRSVFAHLPTVLVFAALAGLFYWGHTSEWKAPRFLELWSGAAAPEGPPAERAEEKPGPTSTDAGAWCDLHGLPLAQCTICRPEIATKGELPAASPDAATVHEPAAPRPDPRTCTTHLLSVTFPSAQAVHKAGLHFAAVREEPLAQYVAATGRLDYDPARVAHLSPRASGMVWRVDKQLGQAVRKGEVLALIEAADVGRAKAEFLQAFTQYDIRAQVLERLKAASSSLPERQLRDAEAALREARIQRFTAQQALANLGLPVRLEDLNGLSDEEIARRIRLLGLPDAVAPTLDPETVTANLLPLTAPFDGVVIGRDMVAGESAGPGQSHFVVADVSCVNILLDVRLEDAGRLAAGQDVAFRTDGTPDEALHGKVAWVSTEVDEKTRTVRVRAEAANPDGRFRAHAFGTGRVLVRATPSAIVVPAEALQWEGCCHIVFVRESETKYQVRKVRLGLRTSRGAEVLAGLVPGEVVVTTGSHMLKSEILKSKIGDED
jgi:cobalt-zinc-cadmium efflux system membrane fusion protein